MLENRSFHRHFAGTVAAAAVLMLVAPASLAGLTEQILVPSNSQAGDLFGYDMDVDGPVAVVGAVWESEAALHSGAAYIYRLTGDTWVEEARLARNVAAAYDDFGAGVAVHGETVLVGALLEYTDATKRGGAAYVYENAGGWTETHRLEADQPTHYSYFGWRTTLTAERAWVGAPFDSAGAAYAGAVYGYDRTNGYALDAKLVPPAIADNDFVGWSVAADGDRVLVGAPGVDAGAAEAGVAYIYEPDTFGVYQLVATLNHPQPQTASYFGLDVGLFGDLAFVNAPFHDTTQADAGAMYVFKRDALGTWNLLSTLTSPAPAASAAFGAGVDLMGSMLFVGEPGTRGTTYGSAHVFHFNEGNGVATPMESWSRPQHLGTGHRVGISDGSHLLASAPANDFDRDAPGKAVAFTTTGDTPDAPADAAQRQAAPGPTAEAGPGCVPLADGSAGRVTGGGAASTEVGHGGGASHCADVETPETLGGRRAEGGATFDADGRGGCGLDGGFVLGPGSFLAAGHSCA